MVGIIVLFAAIAFTLKYGDIVDTIEERRAEIFNSLFTKND